MAAGEQVGHDPSTEQAETLIAIQCNALLQDHTPIPFSKYSRNQGDGLTAFFVRKTILKIIFIGKAYCNYGKKE